MKIYIVTDNEGLAGVSGADYISPDRGRADLIARARQLLADEINACIEGCCRAGATEIVVRDGHGDGQNVTRAMIDPRADLICGATPGVLLADLEGSAGLILLGYHAKAGTPGAVCEHTMSSLTWQSLRINGRSTGEIGICAYIAGEHKVPVIMVERPIYPHSYLDMKVAADIRLRNDAQKELYDNLRKSGHKQI